MRRPSVNPTTVHQSCIRSGLSGRPAVNKPISKGEKAVVCQIIQNLKLFPIFTVKYKEMRVAQAFTQYLIAI